MPPKILDRMIPGDPYQPRAKGVAVSQRTYVLVRGQENLLHDILHLFTRHSRQQHAVNERSILAVHLVKRVFVAGTNSLYEPFVDTSLISHDRLALSKHVEGHLSIWHLQVERKRREPNNFIT